MSRQKIVWGLALAMANILAIGFFYALPYKPLKSITLPASVNVKSRQLALFFGYTTCPTICPTTMQALKQVQENADQGAYKIIFVSLTQPHAAGATADEYAKSFHESFEGWQLPPNELQELLDACHVFFSEATGKQPIQHSPNIYLLTKADAQWQLVAVYHQYPANREDLLRLFSQVFTIV